MRPTEGSDREYRVAAARPEPVLGWVEMDCRRLLSSLLASELDTDATGAKIGIEFTTLPFLSRFYRPVVRLLRIGFPSRAKAFASPALLRAETWRAFDRKQFWS